MTYFWTFFEILLEIFRNNSRNESKYFSIISKLFLEIIYSPKFSEIILEIFWYFSQNYTKFVLKIFSNFKKFIFEYLSITILNWNWKTYEWQYLINVTEVTLKTWNVSQWCHCSSCPLGRLYTYPISHFTSISRVFLQNTTKYETLTINFSYFI